MYKEYLQFFILLILFLALSVFKVNADDLKTLKLSEDLSITELEEDVLFITHHFPWPGNSTVVKINQTDFVMVDTPWHDEATEVLVKWLMEKYGDINLIVINTHFHMDNLGGNGYLLSQNIPVYGSELTVELLEQKGPAAIERTLDFLSDPKNKRYYDVYKKMDLKPPDMKKLSKMEPRLYLMKNILILSE